MKIEVFPERPAPIRSDMSCVYPKSDGAWAAIHAGRLVLRRTEWGIFTDYRDQDAAMQAIRDLQQGQLDLRV